MNSNKLNGLLAVDHSIYLFHVERLIRITQKKKESALKNIQGIIKNILLFLFNKIYPIQGLSAACLWPLGHLFLSKIQLSSMWLKISLMIKAWKKMENSDTNGKPIFFVEMVSFLGGIHISWPGDVECKLNFNAPRVELCSVGSPGQGPGGHILDCHPRDSRKP